MKNLRLGFSPFGFIIVILQAIPNIVWALFPPSLNTLEGNASSIPFIEYGEHILGVAIVVLLLLAVSREQGKTIPMNRYSKIAFLAIALYWCCWILYFCAYQPLSVIYAMVILPPIAFFCAGLAEKVYPISVVSVLFLLFHLAVAMKNFPIAGV